LEATKDVVIEAIWGKDANISNATANVTKDPVEISFATLDDITALVKNLSMLLVEANELP